MELEYVACTATFQEGVWLKRFMAELGIVLCVSKPVTIHCDRIVALAYAKDLMYHRKLYTSTFNTTLFEAWLRKRKWS